MNRKKTILSFLLFVEFQKAKAKASDKNMSKTPKELSTQKRKKQLLSKEKKQKKLENAMASQKLVSSLVIS